MTSATPRPPRADLPQPTSGLHTSLDVVLRLVLGRLDANRATPASVRGALAAAGVIASEEWCADWLTRARAAGQS